MTSQLLPGTILREVELSERLGVSRTPLREALRMLKAEGLVELVPHQGAQVAQVSRQDLIDAYEVREWLEPPAAASAAQRMNDDALTAIEAAMETMPVQPATHDDAVRAEQADLDFHDLILQSTGNRLVRELVRRARVLTQRAAYFVPQGRYSRSDEEHQAILEALRRRDPVAAEALMRQHIIAARSRLFMK